MTTGDCFGLAPRMSLHLCEHGLPLCQLCVECLEEESKRPEAAYFTTHEGVRVVRVCGMCLCPVNAHDPDCPRREERK